MSESPTTNPEINLPSGYKSVEQLPGKYQLPEDALPWVDGIHEVSVARCDVGDDTKFLLASVIGTDKRLHGAAEAMTDKQRQNADNMFYARLAAYMQHGQANGVDTAPKPTTEFAIHVMRNGGGQRAYFGISSVVIEKDKPPQPVVLRLAACDKNKQGQVMQVLSGASDRENRMKMSRSK